jgi:hypothetical protein
MVAETTAENEDQNEKDNQHIMTPKVQVVSLRLASLSSSSCAITLAALKQLLLYSFRQVDLASVYGEQK